MVRSKTRISKYFFAMGTLCCVTVSDERDLPAAEEVRARVLGLHERLNAYDPNSEISGINAAAGRQGVAVSEDTLGLITRAVGFSRRTDGRFDITTTPLSQLWKDAVKSRTLPDEVARRRAAALVDYRDIRIDGRTVMLRRPGQRIDLGSIAKGFAADEARRILTGHGVTDAVINFGGTAVVLGETRRVGIRDPFRADGSAFAAVSVSGAAVVTSGVYEQGFSCGGRIWHHIVDPATGFPSDSPTVSVSLVGGSAEKLDALSTAALILPADAAARLLSAEGVGAVFVSKQGGVCITDGLKTDFQMINRGV